MTYESDLVTVTIVFVNGYFSEVHFSTKFSTYYKLLSEVDYHFNDIGGHLIYRDPIRTKDGNGTKCVYTMPISAGRSFWHNLCAHGFTKK